MTNACKGTLQLFRTQKQYDGTGGDIEVLKQFGVPYEILDPAGCIAAEPALADVKGKFVGGLRLPGDETGDCQMFTEKACRALRGERRDIPLRHDHHLINRQRQSHSQRLDRDGRLTADAYVVAFGSYSPFLLRPLGVAHPGLSDQGLFHHRPVADAREHLYRP